MNINTGWVSPPQSIGGLDHLGTQAPCVLIYSQLLPGVTNVTDRARYYSFYPWLLWSYDQRYPKNKEKFIELFRRADCLFTLIAEQHARVTDHDQERHGTAMVGRIQLVQAINRLESGTALKLSEFTDANSSRRYFQNPLGGLGQYYAGTLSNLLLLSPMVKPWINYTKEYGEPLAKHLGSAIEEDRFWSVIENDEVSLDDLNTLSALCPCMLTQSTDECQSLIDMYFDVTGIYEDEGDQRKKTLGLILNLTQSLSTPDSTFDLDESIFRACIYSKTLPGGNAWDVPENFKNTLNCWALYERNDLLSISFQTIFALLLRDLQPQEWSKRITYNSVEEFSTSFVQSESVKTTIQLLNESSFGGLLTKLTKNGTALSNWSDENHEISIAKRMLISWNRNESTSDILSAAINILALLASRDECSQLPYGSLAISHDALSDYPINLSSFRAKVEFWKSISMEAFITDIANWCINTHFRVALRKLRQTNRSSFHLRPSDNGLEVVGIIPPPANTTPRFRQAVQIMRDIGVLQRIKVNGQTVLSSKGIKLLEEASA